MLIVHLAFLLTGVVTTMLGPMLPFLVRHWQLTDAQAGQLFIAQFLGGFCGSLLAGQLMKRFGSRISMCAGLVLAAVGVATLWSPNFVVGIFALFMYGSAMGITAPATNMLVAQAAPEKSAAALNLLNFSWTAGALMGTPTVSMMLPRVGAPAVTVGIAVSLVASAIAVAARPFRRNLLQVVSPGIGSQGKFPLIVLLTIPILFLYVGVENAVAGWLPLFCSRLFAERPSLVAIVIAVFWAALLSGRLFAPLVLRRISAGSVVNLALAIAGIGSILALASHSLFFLLPGVALTGAGLAVVLPTAVSQVTRFDSLAADRFAGIMFAFAGLGGAAIPPLVGLISTHSGSLRLGMIVAVAGIAIMLLLNLRVSRIINRKGEIASKMTA